MFLKFLSYNTQVSNQNQLEDFCPNMQEMEKTESSTNVGKIRWQLRGNFVLLMYNCVNQIIFWQLSMYNMVAKYNGKI
jgi:hypothetical protein